MAQKDYERLFTAVFERTTNAMLIIDGERRYLGANPAACELLGLPHDEIVKLRLDDLAPPDDREALAERWRTFIRDRYQWGHRTLALPDGHRIPVDYCAMANVSPGRHLAIYLPSHDDGGDAHPTMEHDAPASGHADGAAKLTPRELEVIRQVALGGSSREIGERLFISPGTVKTHVRNAMEKRGARTRAHLVALALDDGLIEI